MKLYTEEQVRMLLDKMSLIAERKNLGVSANFRHRAIEIDKLLKDISPIELPSDEEIEISNPYRLGGGNYNGSAAHQWQKGVEWMKDKILNK